MWPGGQTQQLTATATYSDRTSSDVSDSVTWSVGNTAMATVTPTGLLDGVEAGSTTLTATKDGITSNTVTVEVTAAVITAITVTPATVLVTKGQTQQLTATATYSDRTSSDVSDSVTWSVGNAATATVTPTGLLDGVEVGSTTLAALKDGITSNTVNVNVCLLAGPCIDIFDAGSGKLFTNSPSVAYLDSIGGSATNGTYTENGTYGPAGNFYQFNWDNANELCTTYNSQNIGGRNNWRLATGDELKVELFDGFGNMFAARGWATGRPYWSVTPDGSYYYDVDIRLGKNYSSHPNNPYYASCVSKP
ncbi:Ig-like domain-containing protein [Shewanella sp. DC2-4]|uniref:Ig-like domain-containing protein n=1 Tax=Shewanella sp. DC2-4 TaxID=2739431 RepID=UPI0015661DA2|nr:Ig-like domain-containing protein [Shewanella sp. DC2-4]NRD30249.1 Ig-like domain-containing protein [Shewanella sp. DC2-4]